MCPWPKFVATGMGPYCGQAVHFKHFALKIRKYAVDYYKFKAWRHRHIFNYYLTTQPFMLCHEYIVVDTFAWGRARATPFVLGKVAWKKPPLIKRLLHKINVRLIAPCTEALNFLFKKEVDDDTRMMLL